jgi:hypothetical protein
MIYPNEVLSKGDNVKIGSEIYFSKCNSCHPYGQGIYDPLLFPGSEKNFGSASLLHSKLIEDSSAMLSYIRNPKRMPRISSNRLSEFDFKYIYDYLTYLKFGEILKINDTIPIKQITN